MSETLRSYNEDLEKLSHIFPITERRDFGNAIQKLAIKKNLTKAAIYRLGAKQYLRENGVEIKDYW